MTDYNNEAHDMATELELLEQAERQPNAKIKRMDEKRDRRITELTKKFRQHNFTHEVRSMNHV